MRILICGINFAPDLTGIGVYTSGLARWLQRNGHEVCVVTAPPYYPAWRTQPGYSTRRFQTETLSRIEIIRCPLWVPKQLSAFARIVHYVSFGLSSFFALFYAAWRKTPEVILTIQPPLTCNFSSLIVGRLTGRKTWLHIQDIELDAATELGILRSSIIERIVGTLEKWLLQRFDRVTALTKPMCDRITAKTDGAVPTHVLPNWVDTTRIYPLENPTRLRAQFGISKNKHVVLYSGSLSRKQGIGVISALAKALSHRKDILFVVCGDGPIQSELFAELRTLPNALCLPLQDEEQLNALLNTADIHILPQRIDVTDYLFPSKILGMLASGKPIFSTGKDGTSVAHVVEQCGVLADPTNIDLAATRLCGLIDDFARCKILGERARTLATTQFDIDIVLPAMEQSLFELASVPNESISRENLK